MSAAEDNVTFVDMLAVAGRLFLGAWFVMLTFGVLHGSVSSVPTFGYLQCLLIVAVVTWLIWTATFTFMQRLRSLTPMYGKKAIKAVQANDALAELIERLNRVGKAGTN